MPQQVNNSGCKPSKKKKGRAPAHQNSFAFKHNPKSKKTESILNSPNTRVCRRCHEKIEWRKRYRKYKPRSQPGKCNLCGKRNVKAAYHTICVECTTSDKAFMNILSQTQQQQESLSTSNDTNSTNENTSIDDAVDKVSQTASELTIDDDTGKNAVSTSVDTSSKNHVDKRPCHRVCAMCVKEPALPDEEDASEMTVDALAGNRKLKLRERRALERKLLKQQEASKQAKHQEKQEAEEEEEVCNENDNGNESESDERHFVDGNDTEEDDLIKAVGGKDKLITGEAYQKMLLEREQQV